MEGFVLFCFVILNLGGGEEASVLKKKCRICFNQYICFESAQNRLRLWEGTF